MSLSEFGSGEWFELAQKMFDFTSDNVFVIGTVGEAPNILLTNTTCATCPRMYWADQLRFDRYPHGCRLVRLSPRG